jgi:hypothetical protein
MCPHKLIIAAVNFVIKYKTSAENTLECINFTQALQDDVETLQPNVKNIESTLQKLLNNADPNFAAELQLQVEILVGKWKKVVEGAKEQNIRLKDALEKSKMVRWMLPHLV